MKPADTFAKIEPIDWDCDCPLIGIQRDGPCFPEFKVSFECYHYSKNKDKVMLADMAGQRMCGGLQSHERMLSKAPGLLRRRKVGTLRCYPEACRLSPAAVSKQRVARYSARDKRLQVAQFDLAGLTLDRTEGPPRVRERWLSRLAPALVGFQGPNLEGKCELTLSTSRLNLVPEFHFFVELTASFAFRKVEPRNHSLIFLELKSLLPKSK